MRIDKVVFYSAQIRPTPHVLECFIRNTYALVFKYVFVRSRNSPKLEKSGNRRPTDLFIRWDRHLVDAFTNCFWRIRKLPVPGNTRTRAIKYGETCRCYVAMLFSEGTLAKIKDWISLFQKRVHGYCDMATLKFRFLILVPVRLGLWELQMNGMVVRQCRSCWAFKKNLNMHGSMGQIRSSFEFLKLLWRLAQGKSSDEL